MDPDALEARRLALQAELDAQKTARERNALGQFATPTALARELVALGLRYLPPGPVRFLDPALGTGSFFSALLASGRPARAHGVELDDHYGAPARALWSGHTIQSADFTRLTPDPSYDLLVCNPPYVRHHHLAPADKARLVGLSSEVAGQRVSGLAGLYVHFMLLGSRWLAPGGVAVWLVPSEFMDVNYGRPLKEHLCRDLTLLRVHRSDPRDAQFGDALVSSAVVVARSSPPPADHRVEVTFGGSLSRPASAARVPLAALSAPKWTRLTASAPLPRTGGPALGDFFEVKRGIATGDNRFFILPEARVRELGLPPSAFRPILPPPRRVRVEEIQCDADGVPTNVDRLFLLDCAAPEADLAPALRAYLASGADTVATGYLCSRRRPWYTQERRAPAPIVCTYMARGPFRFLRNRSRATAANVYLLLYPREPLTDGALDAVWGHLAALDPSALLRESRVYGGGLHKLEPGELARVPVPATVLSQGRAP